MGFRCGKADSSLFILHKGHSIILLLIYVDDIIITGNDNKIIGNLINTLSAEFSLKDLGPLHYFLGLEIKYIRNGLFVSQLKYIKDLLEHTKKMEYTSIFTPVASLPLLHLLNDLLILDNRGKLLDPLNI